MDFDLVTEPWIPARRMDGAVEELGIIDALSRAHELAEIVDPLPTVEFGLYRLLTALVQDAFRVADYSDVVDLLDAGEFSPDVLSRALTPDKDGQRWNLFSPTAPFLQCSGMDDEPDKPLAGLVPSVPSGTGTWHFHHAAEAEFAACPEAAARLLTTIAPFMTAGGAGLNPSVNGAPPWYALIVGGNLFETLALNCCGTDRLASVDLGSPTWRPPAVVQPERRQGASLLESLSWRPRRIRLIPGPAGVCSMTGRHAGVTVRTMKFAAGWGAGFEWTDPNVAYRITDKGRSPVRPQEGRDIWRDTGAFALLTEDMHGVADQKVAFRRPAVVDQFADLVRERRLPRAMPLRMRVYGMRTDLKMKVFEWQAVRLGDVPAEMAWRGAARESAQQAMNLASDVDYRLRRAVRAAYPRDGASNDKAFANRAADAARAFWGELRPGYAALLTALASQPDDGAEARKDWANAVRAAGHRALDRAIGDLDSDGDALFRQTGARREFANAVAFLLLTPEEKQARTRRPPDTTNAKESTT